MNDFCGIPFEEFRLDERVYERSLMWASLFKKYNQEDKSLDVIDVNADDAQLVELFGCETSNAEAKETKKAQNKNVSVLELETLSDTLIRQKQARQTPLKKMVENDEEDDEEEEEEEEDDDVMDDIVNTTQPIILEHMRKWEESGMLEVLETFDETIIEEKVGAWLQNNSLLGGKIKSTSCDTVEDENLRSNKAQRANVKSSEETDSMHSTDTARYVLRNRKPRKTKSSSHTMTIKNFCLAQSRREALREKFSTGDLANPPKESNKKALHLQQQQPQLTKKDAAVKELPSSRQPTSTLLGRRKLYSKRANATDAAESDSSSDWETENKKRILADDLKSQRFKEKPIHSSKLRNRVIKKIEAPQTKCKAPCKLEMVEEEEEQGENDSFLRNLSLAIKLSELDNEREQQIGKKEKEKYTLENERCNTMLKNNTVPAETTQLDNTAIDLNCTLAKLEENFSSAERKLKPQPKSIKLKKLRKSLQHTKKEAAENSTCLSFAQNVCNSTAMAGNGRAAQNQFSKRFLVHADETPVKGSHSAYPAASTSKVAYAEVSSTVHTPVCAKKKKENSAVLLYTPKQPESIPRNSVSNGVFTVTQQYLEQKVGTELAKKFFKYRGLDVRFKSNLNVYYRPPPGDLSETDSEDDFLQKIDRCGYLYATTTSSDEDS